MPCSPATWREATPPDIAAGRTTGRMRSCDHCGSMHPADVAAAIVAGAKGGWADHKYGWPHKAYFQGVPNPHAGMLESRCSMSHPPQAEIDAGKWIRVPSGFYSRATGEPEYTWVEAGKPAPATTTAKFYTVHLLDASPEERAVIEAHLGLQFHFEGDSVRWGPVVSH